MADDTFRGLTVCMKRIVALIESTRETILAEQAATRSRSIFALGIMFDGRPVPWLQHLDALTKDMDSFRRVQEYHRRLATLEGLLETNRDMRVRVGLRILQNAGAPLNRDVCDLISGVYKPRDAVQVAKHAPGDAHVDVQAPVHDAGGDSQYYQSGRAPAAVRQRDHAAHGAAGAEDPPQAAGAVRDAVDA
jgi:hypothetical protein